MPVLQDQFTRALLAADEPVPDGLSDPEGRPAGKRFDVYRNNVAASLNDALETAFPVIAKLVGSQNFRVLAGAYLRQHPPSSPLMMHYGAAMPGFLAAFPPTANTGYLPDVARLELALRQSYHAADAPALDPARLQVLLPERLLHARLILAPSVRLIRSAWPLHAIWRFNTEADAPKPEMAAEDVLVVRPGFDPWPEVLPGGGGGFVEAVLEGANFGAAHEAAEAEMPGFDLAEILGVLIRTSALTDIEEDR